MVSKQAQIPVKAESPSISTISLSRVLQQLAKLGVSVCMPYETFLGLHMAYVEGARFPLPKDAFKYGIRTPKQRAEAEHLMTAIFASGDKYCGAALEDLSQRLSGKVIVLSNGKKLSLPEIGAEKFPENHSIWKQVTRYHEEPVAFVSLEPAEADIGTPAVPSRVALTPRFRRNASRFRAAANR